MSSGNALAYGKVFAINSLDDVHREVHTSDKVGVFKEDGGSGWVELAIMT